MTTPLLHLLWLGAAAGAVSLLIGAVIRAHATSLRLVDLPTPRSSHATPTPRGGGLGIVVGAVGGLLLLRPVGVEIAPHDVAALAGGGLLVAAVSLVDDLRGLPPVVRLGIHVAAGVIAVGLVGSMSAVEIPQIGVVHLGWPAAAITVLWIAGMTNAYNFMDGIDGLAGAQAVTAAIAWIIAGWWLGRGDLMGVGVLIAATCAGFLVHNWSPASLFMGDVGSAFLGYSLAVITTIASQQQAVLPVVGAILLWPFIFDPIYTLIRRVRQRENLLAAHRSHLYQRLVAAGWGHRAVCQLYLMLGVLASVAGVGLVIDADWASTAAMIYLVGSVILVSGLVRWREAQATAP